MNPKDMAASVRQRLLNRARAEGRDFQSLLVSYAIERFLWRLSASPYAERFILKGALLFPIWQCPAARPTVDADFLAAVLDACAGNAPFEQRWEPPGPWKPA